MGMVIAILRLVVKRSLNNINLLVTTIIGLVVTVSLVAAVPLYSDAMIERLLQKRLQQPSQRPPGAVRIRHLEEKATPSTLDQFRRLDEFVLNNAEWIMGLPLKRPILRYFATDTHLLQGVAETEKVNPLASEAKYAYIAFQQGLEKYIRIVEGQGLPPGPSPDDVVPVILSTTASEELHMYVGESYYYIGGDRFNPARVTLKVVGLWEPLEPNSDYWLYHPDVMYNTLFTTEEHLFQNILKIMPQAIHEYSWYMIFDHNALHSTNVDRVLGGLRYLETRVATMMPNTKVDLAPGDLLEEFARRAFLLKLLLFALSIPMLAVILYYIITSVGMVIDRQRSEIAVFKSRGMSTFQIIGLYLLEGVLIGGIALAIGPLIGIGVAQLIGQSYSFLLFAQRPPLPVMFSTQTLQYAALAAGLAVLAMLVPAVGAARYTIITYKQEVARSYRRPLWQRFFVDILLLAVAAYGYRTLQQQRSILNIAGEGEIVVDPLMLLVPSLFIFALALLFLRLFPLLTAGLARLGSLFGNAPVVLALRQIARMPLAYSPLVLLLTLTLALGAFAASAAHTMNRNFTERVLYEIPADLILTEVWEYNETENYFIEPPFSAHEVPGVVALTRAKQFTARPNIGRGQQRDVQVLGVDRTTFANVAWWRSDFAPRPLGALMNALAIDESAAITTPAFLARYQLNIGDTVQLVFGNKIVDFRIVEVADYFPTLYPEKGDFFVANLDYLYDQTGLQPYDVWVKVDPNYRSQDVVEAMEKNGIRIVRIRDSRVQVNVGRLDPQRTGLFGVLSIGFIVAALLTVLGFFLYAFLSFQKRMLQMGILRAIGLSSAQLFVLLMLEQVFLIVLGIAAGTAFGLWTSSLFIPFLQVSADQYGTTPRFVVELAWGDVQRIYVIMGLMLAVGLLCMIVLLRRMKIYQAVKLGEQL